MSTTLIKNARIVNEGQITESDLLIRDGRIDRIASNINDAADQIIEAAGQFLFPGCIDDQVHFREPGLTHKAEIATESRAAVAGGITSFMEMPNTVPNTLTQELLQEKYDRAAQCSPANYSFYMGASNENLEEVLKTDPQNICGIKVFMGSSTGNMLVDDEEVLSGIFENAPCLVATHCEKEEIVRANLAKYKEEYGEDIPIEYHPIIRSEEACYASSSLAVELAKKFGTRLHILHISTAKELSLFDSTKPLKEKKITAEACIHHLWFHDEDYKEKAQFIKWNPAVKTKADRDAIRAAVNSNAIDVLATDHAPHTLEEKNNLYTKAPSGGPLVQHALPAALEMVNQGAFTYEQIANKFAHAVADCFNIVERGYIREGYWADLVLVDSKPSPTVSKENVLYKCGWSPFEGISFGHTITHTFVNGQLAFREGELNDGVRGMRMSFDRPR